MSAWKQIQKDIQKRATGVVSNVMSISKSRMVYRLELSEQDLQEKLDELLPVSKTKYGSTLYLSDPRIRLHGNSREVGLFCRADVHAPLNLKISGSAKFRGAVVYEQEEAAFYIRRLKIEQLVISGLPEGLSKNLKRLAQIATATALERYPVYTLGNVESTHKFARMALRSLRVNGDKLEIEMGM